MGAWPTAFPRPRASSEQHREMDLVSDSGVDGQVAGGETMVRAAPPQCIFSPHKEASHFEVAHSGK